MSAGLLVRERAFRNLVLFDYLSTNRFLTTELIRQLLKPAQTTAGVASRTRYSPLPEQPDLCEISPTGRGHRNLSQYTRHRVVAYPLAIEHVGHQLTTSPPDREAVFTVTVKEDPANGRDRLGSATMAHGLYSRAA